MMRFEPRKWFAALAETVRLFPVETGIVAFTLFAGAPMIAGAFSRFHEGMALIPLFFASAYVLNNLLRGGPFRWGYRLCWIVMLPLWWSASEEWIESTAYFVAYPCLLLAVLACRRVRDDGRFAEEAVAYLYAAAVAGFFATVAYCLLLAIYYSLIYIFGLEYSFIPDFGSYSALLCYGTACPMMLLAFVRGALGGGMAGSGMFTTLLNWIVTPALLVYTAILYLYFVTIAVSWSLPKGGIAYMVFAFAMTAVAVGACQPLLRKRMYGWFFGRFGLVALPAVAMFWIGVLYRVGEYGLTEARVYLLVCGAVMTFSLGLLFSKRGGRYLGICTAAFALLVLCTYIPPVSAGALGEASQRDRVERIASRLGLLDGAGCFDAVCRPLSDTVYREDYRRMYESLEYLEREKRSLFGLQEADDLLKIAPEPIEGYICGWDTVEVDTARTLYLSDDRSSFDVRGYAAVSFPGQWSSGPDRYSFGNDTLRIYTDSVLRCVVSGRELLAEQLRAIGCSEEARPGKRLLEKNAGKLLVWRTDSLTVLFSSMNLRLSPEQDPEIYGLDIRCVLER